MHDTCFVDILDVKGKAGSVHVSRIVTRRERSDVDQNTGKDLLPLNKSGEDGDGGSVNVGSGVDNSNNKSWISLPVLNFFLESKIEDGEGVRKGNPTGVFSLMEDNIDNDGQKRGKREDSPPNPIATDGDRVVLAFAYVAIFIPRKPDITEVMAPRINDMVLKTYVNRAGLHWFNDGQWRFATLPFAFGGLGVYSASDVLSFVFLASRLQFAGLQTKLLQDTSIVAARLNFDDALSVFNKYMETDLLSNSNGLVEISKGISHF
ncbi:hypothetical protein Tco_0400060 [Tanacetum coccineum]